MIKIQNDCVGCPIYCADCGAKHTPHFYCDRCGNEYTLYYYNDEELCLECIIEDIQENLQIVEGSDI